MNQSSASIPTPLPAEKTVLKGLSPLAMAFFAGMVVAALPFVLVIVPGWKELAKGYKTISHECNVVLGSINRSLDGEVKQMVQPVK